MKIIYGLGRVKRLFKNPVVALGVFDGVHLGHQFLLKKVMERAKKIKGTSVVITFFPHPSHVLNPRKELPFLISLKERLRLISLLGVDACIVIKFSPGFANIKAKDFVENYLVDKLHSREIYVGRDFVFGSDRKGKVRLLKQLARQNGFKVTAVAPVLTSGSIVSSTRIRNLIKKNELLGAGKLLNYPLAIRGKVVRGAGMGRSLGFPTVNLKDYEGALIGRGVYAARVLWKKRHFFGMAFIGRRPAFVTSDRAVSAEVHIFGFKNNIYGQEISVEFLKKIRKERRFSTAADLIAQLKNDYQLSKKIARSFQNLP
jgi:riboflavin kinase / FMN adenylyltransferase